MGDWLASHEVTVVGMESTGVAWKPVYYLLEDEFECWLLNAQHLRNVPGRKTTWLTRPGAASWLSTGWCVPASCLPSRSGSCASSPGIARRCSRSAPGRSSGSRKLLEDAGIKLGGVASDVLGVSGRLLLDALVGGTTDPEVLADLARGALGKKLPVLREARQGVWHTTTGCSWPSCSPTWTTWTRQSSG